MTHTINSNKNLVSIDITQMHTQMRKSPRGEKESGKEMRRDRDQKKRKKTKQNLKKKSINKLKIKKIKNKINIKSNKNLMILSCKYKI